MGLETTLRRPIVNTPRRAPRRPRSSGDASTSSSATRTAWRSPTFLKLGTTSLSWQRSRRTTSASTRSCLPSRLARCSGSHATSPCANRLALASAATRATALEVQRALLEIASDYVADAEDADVVARWESLLERLARDMFEAAREVEWVAKLQLLGRMRAKYHGVTGRELALGTTRARGRGRQWSELGSALRRGSPRREQWNDSRRMQRSPQRWSARQRDTRAWLRGAHRRGPAGHRRRRRLVDGRARPRHRARPTRGGAP